MQGMSERAEPGAVSSEGGVNGNGALRLIGETGVTFGKYGLTLPPDLSFKEWERIGQTLQAIQGAILWWWGDWICYGESKYGEMYAQAIEVTGYSIETLKKARSLSIRFPPPERTELSWSHHLAVAYLPPEERTEKLQKAIENHWSRRELQDAIKTDKPRNVECFWDSHVLTQCAKHQRPIRECC
jgi:hypothetical protein